MIASVYLEADFQTTRAVWLTPDGENASQSSIVETALFNLPDEEDRGDVSEVNKQKD